MMKNKKFYRGFTLIELVISIFIIAVLSTLLLTNYHFARKRTELAETAQKAASDIRLAQQYSLGSFEFGGVVPAGGWGVYFDIAAPDYYLIFADADGDHTYTSGEEYSQVNLPQRISVASVSDDDPGTPDGAMAVVFLPPDPVVYAAGLTGNRMRITLSESDNNSSKTVEVNFLGLVDVVN